jgi:hypothetical protein
VNCLVGTILPSHLRYSRNAPGTVRSSTPHLRRPSFVSESDKDPTSLVWHAGTADPELFSSSAVSGWPTRRVLLPLFLSPAATKPSSPACVAGRRRSPPQAPTARSVQPSINTSDRDSAKTPPRIPPPVSPSPSPSLSTSSPSAPSSLEALHVAMDAP